MAKPVSVQHTGSSALADVVSPAEHFSEIIGADLQVHQADAVTIPVQTHHEHALLVLSGDCHLHGQILSEGVLYYLGTQREELTLASGAGARVLLVGGALFPETVLVWWNFVARTPDEIRQARTDWEEHRRFGDVPAYNGPRLAAPPLNRLAPPNPVS